MPASDWAEAVAPHGEDCICVWAPFVGSPVNRVLSDSCDTTRMVGSRHCLEIAAGILLGVKDLRLHPFVGAKEKLSAHIHRSSADLLEAPVEPGTTNQYPSASD